MHKYAFPRRIVIICLLFQLLVIGTFASTRISFLNDQLREVIGIGPVIQKNEFRPISLFVDALGDYRTAQSGNWNSITTWQKFDGTGWVAATAAPNNNNARIVTIRNFHTVTITVDVEYDNVIVESGAQLTVNPSVTHVLNNGSVTGTDLIIQGTFLNRGSNWVTSGATWSVAAGGTYIHDTTNDIAGPLDNATLESGSSFIYRKSSASNPNTDLANQTYSNLAFETTSGTYTLSFLSTSPLTVNGTFRVGPNVNWSKSATGALILNGDVLLEGSLTSNTSITIGNGKVLTLSGTGTAVMTAQTLTINGTLRTGSSSISGAGNFVLGATGILEIGSPDGITTSPTALGSIRNTGTRTFNTSGSYVYNGSVAQVTGNGLPPTAGTLKIDNGTGVTLSSPTSISGSLNLTNGKLVTSASNSLSVGGLANSIAGGSSASFISGPLRRTFGASPADPLIFPIGKSSFNPFELVAPSVSGGTVTVEAEVFDANSNGSAGSGLASINTDRYWTASILNGSGNFNNSQIRLTDPSVNADSKVGKSATVNGVYDSIGGTVAGSTILSNSLSTFSSFVIGTSAPIQHILTVNKVGPGNVTSSPAGIDCGGDCTQIYAGGSQVELTAMPDAGAAFTGWSGGVCSGAGQCLVTMDTAKAVTATFDPLPTPNISINDVSQTEGNAGTSNFQFSATLSSPAPVNGVSFDISTTDSSASAASDYQTNSSTGVTIPAGSNGPYLFSVTVTGDTAVEPDETFNVNLTNVNGASAGDTQGVGTIINDDLPPSISAVTVVRTAGSGLSSSTIANVSDPIDPANTLAVTVNGGASATQNGVTVSDISVDNSGVVTANVEAATGASDAAFSLTVTNSGTQTAVSTLQVNVLAECPVTGTWTQKAKRTSTGGAAGDRFGASVDVDGDTMVVGALGENGGQGAAYVYIRNGGSWTLQQKLTAADGVGGDNFGSGVAISGDTAVVGAPADDGKGSAYVFVRTGAVWTEQTKLTASDGGADDKFGRMVAISGETAVVGAHAGNGGNGGNAPDTGAAYVYTRSGTSWNEQQKLTAVDGLAGDEFGWDVAISGDTAVVGAKLNDAPTDKSGSAYVFVRNGATWSQQEKLTASDGAPQDEFGFSVGMSGDTLIVGAPLDEHGDPVNLNGGSAYVFTRNGADWTQQQKLTATGATHGDLFGYSTALSGDTAIIGTSEIDLASDPGSAYVFTRSGQSWTQKQKLTASDGAGQDRFGVSVAITSGMAVIGADQDDEPGANSGSAYVFALDCPTPPTGPHIVIELDGNPLANGSTVDFGTQQFQTGSLQKVFTVRNIGSANLTVNSPFGVTGDQFGEFQINNSILQPIGPGETGTFSITFSPLATGERTASISISSNDADPADSPFVIDVKGFGEMLSGGTYTWIGADIAAPTDWSDPDNWNPVRVAPHSQDTLIIDGDITAAPTITNVGGLVAGSGSGETIARLLITDNASATISALSSGKTLAITGGEGADLDIGPGSTLRVTGSVPLTFSVGASATASIMGSGTPTGILMLEDGSHKLLGNAAGAIVVGAKGVVSTGPTYPASAYPFGSGISGDGAAGSVIFQSGSVYTHNSGNSPFGAAGSPAVTVFQDGSLAQWFTNSGFQASGRTYADLNVGSPTAAVELFETGNGNFSVANLKIISTDSSNSRLTFIGSGASGVTLRGNIRSEGAGNGTAPDVILSSGPTGQTTISKTGGGTATFDTVGNARAMLFDSDAVISSGTTLALGRILVMGSQEHLVLQASHGAGITGGSNGYVIGNLRKIFQMNDGVNSQSYPIGTVNGYSPVEAAYTASQAGEYQHTIRANAAKLPGVSGLDALNRYWDLSSVTGIGTVTANITFGYLQADVIGNEANYKAIRLSSGVFSQINPAVLDTTGNLVTVNGVAPSGTWTLADPTAIEAGSLQFGQAAYSVDENGTNVMLNVTRTAGSDGVVSVQFSTANGSASSPGDFASQTGTLNWSAGDTATKSITITINNDGIVEGSENFTVNLTSASGMALLGAPNSAVVTINDDEIPDQLLTVELSGNRTGTVTSSPAGISCGSDCESEYPANSIVTLTAIADVGSKFIGWTGCSPISANSCQVTLNAAKTVNAEFALITITGKVRLQNTLGKPVPLEDIPVAGVDLTAQGTPSVTGSTGADGNYSMSGFGGGAYTVTPTKAEETPQSPNAITAYDASIVAGYVVGLEDFTAHQIAAADVSGVAGVSSYDATLIARWVVGLPDTVNRSGKWAFSPSSIDHGVISDNIIQNYDALLFGDVTGDYGEVQQNTLASSDENSPVRVSLQSVFAQTGLTVVVPLKIEGLAGTNVRSYQFDIEYDPSVLTPDTIAADLAGTIGQGMNLVYNVPSPGLLKVAAFDVYGVMGDGVYANLRFTATGPAGSASQLALKGFRFNDGKTMTTVTDGEIFVGSAEGVRVNGRLITAAGQGVRGTQVTITAANGNRFAATSSSLGYFEFPGLLAGENYTLRVQSRRYRFAPVSVSTSQAVTSVEMIALE